MSNRCRLFTTNYREDLIEQLAGEMRESRRDRAMNDPTLADAGAYWQEVFRGFAHDDPDARAQPRLMVGSPKSLEDLRRLDASLRVSCQSCGHARELDREQLIRDLLARRLNLTWS